jgi:hypothetical protein
LCDIVATEGHGPVLAEALAVRLTVQRYVVAAEPGQFDETYVTQSADTVPSRDTR